MSAPREAANAERAARPAPEFLCGAERADWQKLPEATRVYVWRRLDELCAAPARRETKLAKHLGFASAETLRAFQAALEPFAHHAAAHDITLSGYLAFFAGNEAKARDGDMIGAMQSLLAFVGLDPEKLGRGILNASATLHLPPFNAALGDIFAAFGARAIGLADARRALLELASGGNALGLTMNPDASSFQCE
jgi:hypothetical protein